MKSAMHYRKNTIFLAAYFLHLCSSYVCEEASQNSTLPQMLLISPSTEAESEEKEMLQQEKANCTDYFQTKEFILLKNGSLMLPNSSDTYSDGNYFLKNGTAFICRVGINSTTTTSQYSDELLSCGLITVPASGYKVLENGSIHIEKYSKTYGPRDHIIRGDVAYVCIPDFISDGKGGSYFRGHEKKHTHIYSYITMVGLSLSIISLFAHLAIFCMLPTVRDFPGYCLANLSLSLIVSYLCFIGITFAEGTQHCANLGVSLYYFFLKSFLWMNVISFDICRSFRKVLHEIRIPTHKFISKRFLLYFLYCSLVPAALAVFAKVADSTTFMPEDYRPSFGDACWFGRRKAVLIFFGVPLFVIMALNVLFFFYVIYVIKRMTMETSESQTVMLKKRFWVFMRLSLLMGLTWIIGLISGNVENEYLDFLFLILNTFQGVFIFAIFSCSSKVRGLCMKRFRKYSASKSDTTSTPACTTVA